MRTHVNLILCWAVISSSACKTKVTGYPKDTIIFKKFPVERILNDTEYIRIDNFLPDGLCLYADSILFIRNAANSSKYHFSLFNLKNKSFLTNVLEAGRKDGQSLGFLSYGILGKYLWVHDIVKDKIILLSIDSINGTNNKFREIILPIFYYSLQPINDSVIIGSGDYESDYKLAELNLSRGNIEGKIIPYSKDSSTSSPRAEKTAYESFLFLKPSGEKCVLACRYADQIEIIDLKARKSKIIKGPEIYEPEVSVMTGNDGKKLSTRNSDTRYAFVKGKVTNNFIYLLYSGNNNNSEHLYYGKFIYVYDWNGRPVQKIELNDYILDFVVTKNDSLIYTYDPKSKYIKAVKLAKQ